MSPRTSLFAWRSMPLIVGMVACSDPNTAPVIAALGDVPPIVSDLTISPTTVHPGEAFTVSYRVVSARPIAYTEVIYQPRLTASFVKVNDAHGAAMVAEVTSVPAMDPPPGAIAANLAIIAVDQDGRVNGLVGEGFTAVGTVSGTILGLVPPVCAPNTYGFVSCGFTTVVVGDTVQLSIDARSPQDLAWIGYRIGPPINSGDSVAVRGLAASKVFTVPVTSQWRPNTRAPDVGLPAITFFTRDLFDHRPTSDAITSFTRVIIGPRRPYALAPLRGSVGDIVFDTVRSVLYLSQPDSQRILRLSLTTMTYEPPITLPGRPGGLDLSRGCDSLLVGLAGTRELGVVNLETGAVTRLPILGLPTDQDALRLWFLRVAANGKVFMSMASTSYYRGDVWEYDLNTSQQGRRLDAGSWGGPISPLGDPSHLVVGTHIYAAATDVMTPSLAQDLFGDVTSDADGRYILTGNRLWMSDFTPVRAVTRDIWSNDFDATAISRDGVDVFIATPFGYRVARVSDDAVTEDVPVAAASPSGRVFQRFLPLPGGQTLVGLGSREVARIDLRPLTPAGSP